MKKLLNKDIVNILFDDTKPILIRRLLYIVIGAVSLGMTVVNLITEKRSLMYVTLGFGIVCVIVFGITFIKKIPMAVSTVIFLVSLIVMCAYFLQSGNPEGFSAIWAVMIPPFALILFGTKKGTIISGIMFIIIVFFCWIPIGKSLVIYPYTASFMLRFPLFYIAMYGIAFCMAFSIYYIIEKNKWASTHDTLTKVLNRTGFNEELRLDATNGKSEYVGAILIDLDYFKAVNDTYGHLVGDEILCYVVDGIQKSVTQPLIRWGGEEFTVYYSDAEHIVEEANQILNYFQTHRFEKDDIVINQTVSIGVAVTKRETFVEDALFSRIDDCLYQAKANGRNCVVVEDYSEK